MSFSVKKCISLNEAFSQFLQLKKLLIKVGERKNNCDMEEKTFTLADTEGHCWLVGPFRN